MFSKPVRCLAVCLLILISSAAAMAQLADSPWPKTQGPGTRNTGRSPYAGPREPNVKWVYDLGDITHFRSPSIGPDGTIYAATTTVLFAINPDGSVKWTTTIPDQYLYHVTVGADGFLYVQSSFDKIFKIKAADGTPAGGNWPIQHSAQGIYPATISESGIVVYGNGGGTAALHAYRLDGTIAWEIQSYNNVETLPAIDEKSGYVFAGNNYDQLIKVKLATGAAEFKNLGVGGYLYSHIALGDDDTVYCTNFINWSTSQCYLFALDSSLNEKWRVHLGSTWVIPPSIGWDGTIYTAGRTTQKLTAVSPAGTIKWDLGLDGDFNAPPVIDAAGVVYVVTANSLYAVETSGGLGTIKWRHDLHGQGYPQPAIGANGDMYVLTKDGILTALGSSNAKPVAIGKNIEVLADIGCQASIAAGDVDGGSYDPDGDQVTLSLDQAGPFGLGRHVIHLTATDPAGLADTVEAVVTVVDATPPVITLITATPELLWPANHRMVPVIVNVQAGDACGAGVQAKIVSVESDEPVEGLGDGDTSPDWEITGDLSVLLRAERSGTGIGRTYTIKIEVRDMALNPVVGVVQVFVPHSKRR